MIEYMLSRLDSLDKEETNLPDGQTAWSESQSIHMAHEIRKFMDEMPGGFFIYHADGDEEIIYANKALLRMFQCDTMEEFRHLTGNSFKGLVHPDDLEDVERSIKEQIAKSQYDLDYVEYRIICKDGTVRWIEDYGHFIRNESTGDMFYVFVGDSTEKKERLLAERMALIDEKQEREQALQSMLDQYDQELKVIRQEHLRRLEVIEGLSVNYDSILYADLDRDKIMPYRISLRIENMFDKKFQQLDYRWYVDTYVSSWVYSEDRQMLKDAMAPEAIRNRLSKSSSFYVNYRIASGNEMLYIQMLIANTGNSGHISQVVMGFRRVDQEIQHEMEQKKVMEEALSRANLANVAKNTFLSNMSHDLRTPLNAIFGFTELAKRNLEDKKAAAGYLERIEASSRQLLGLINDVLELSWMETADIQLNEEMCSLPELLEGLHREMMPQAREKNIEFSLEIGNIIHKDVYSDREKLRQLLRYLLDNAIKYTNYGGKVSLHVTELKNLHNEYGVYEFQINDTGIGISEEFQKHMFDSFAREKNTTSSGVHGTGLGLTISKNIVDRMGGTIGFHSVLGEGSQFTVTLKFKTKEGFLVSLEGQERLSSHELQNRRILVVEDNEINREIETELLESLGMIVDTAEDGSIALDKITNREKGPYSMVLMDIQMPVMDGYEATRAIRALDDPELARVPIVALSANALEGDIRMALESGMNAHVAKPFDLENLSEMISIYSLKQ